MRVCEKAQVEIGGAFAPKENGQLSREPAGFFNRCGTEVPHQLICTLLTGS